MPKIEIYSGQIEQVQADALVIFILQPAGISGEIESQIDNALNGALSDIITSGDFSGKLEQTGVVYTRGLISARRIVMAGLGTADDLTPESIRRASAVAVKRAQELGAGNAVLVTPPSDLSSGVRAAIEGALLALWTYQGQKTSPDDTKKLSRISLFAAESDIDVASVAAGVAAAYARGTNLARDLANLPPNTCTPEYLADQAARVASEWGLRVEILERSQMESLRMGALLGVAQASRNPPRFIILEHNSARASELATLVLVGKGVTFDTGGYTIKTGEGMIGMKGDMSGGAAVIGAMQTIAELAVPLHVVGLVPASENLIDANAYRPQDVLTASNGKTIEIISTDAEGRLLLADALVYAGRYHPDAVVDIATLTGSASVALGSVNAALFSSDDSLRDVLVTAGAAVHERVWPMPLMPEYRRFIDTDTADMKNSAGAKGGACIAAAFLKEFTDYPRWAHVDMAGMFADYQGSPYIPGKGMSGYGARLLTEFVRTWTMRKGA